MQNEVIEMPYRKVTTIEQLWYVLRYKTTHLFEKKGEHDVKAVQSKTEEKSQDVGRNP